MKPVSKMINTDKAVTLHRLFPEAIQNILVYIVKHADFLETHKEGLSKQWEDKQQLFSFDYWLNTAVSTRGIIDQYYKRMLKSPSLFADQLFDMPYVLFVNDCIVKYAKTLKEGAKLKKMIEILFCG